MCLIATLHFVQVLAFGGELLSNAEGLLRSGLHTTEVADGYIKAGSKVMLTPILMHSDLLHQTALCRISTIVVRPIVMNSTVDVFYYETWCTGYDVDNLKFSFPRKTELHLPFHRQAVPFEISQTNRWSNLIWPAFLWDKHYEMACHDIIAYEIEHFL